MACLTVPVRFLPPPQAGIVAKLLQIDQPISHSQAARSRAAGPDVGCCSACGSLLPAASLTGSGHELTSTTEPAQRAYLMAWDAAAGMYMACPAQWVAQPSGDPAAHLYAAAAPTTQSAALTRSAPSVSMPKTQHQHAQYVRRTPRPGAAAAAAVPTASGAHSAARPGSKRKHASASRPAAQSHASHGIMDSLPKGHPALRVDSDALESAQDTDSPAAYTEVSHLAPIPAHPRYTERPPPSSASSARQPLKSTVSAEYTPVDEFSHRPAKPAETQEVGPDTNDDVPEMPKPRKKTASRVRGQGSIRPRKPAREAAPAPAPASQVDAPPRETSAAPAPSPEPFTTQLAGAARSVFEEDALHDVVYGTQHGEHDSEPAAMPPSEVTTPTPTPRSSAPADSVDVGSLLDSMDAPASTAVPDDAKGGASSRPAFDKQVTATQGSGIATTTKDQDANNPRQDTATPLKASRPKLADTFPDAMADDHADVFNALDLL